MHDRHKRVKKETFAKALILGYLHELNEHEACPYTFNDICTARNAVHADVQYDGVLFQHDYMDARARHMTSLIAQDLRDEIGKAIFFDLNRGHLTFFS